RPTWLLGGHGRHEHGARDTYLRPRRPVRATTRHDAIQRRALRPARRFNRGCERALAFIHLALHRHPARRLNLHGRPLLAHTKGWWHIGACAGDARIGDEGVEEIEAES